MKSQRGFTIIEILVSVGLVGLLIAILMTTYRSAFLRDYVVSSEARSLTSSINLARMRAVQKRLSLAVTDSICVASSKTTDTTSKIPVDWYANIQIKGTSPVPLGYQQGDFVIFSNLGIPKDEPGQSPGFMNLNGGAFRIVSVDVQDEFTVVYFPTPTCFYTTIFTCAASMGIQSGSGEALAPTYGPRATPTPRPYAYAQNITRSSMVIIRRLSQRAYELSKQPDGNIRKIMEANFDRPEYYWYNDRVPPMAPGAPVPPAMAPPGAPSPNPVIELREGIEPTNRGRQDSAGKFNNDSLFIWFNPRGLASYQTGYQVRIQNKQGSRNHLRWVTVNPNGRAVLAAGKDWNATFPAP